MGCSPNLEWKSRHAQARLQQLGRLKTAPNDLEHNRAWMHLWDAQSSQKKLPRLVAQQARLSRFLATKVTNPAMAAIALITWRAWLVYLT